MEEAGRVNINQAAITSCRDMMVQTDWVASAFICSVMAELARDLTEELVGSDVILQAVERPQAVNEWSVLSPLLRYRYDARQQSYRNESSKFSDW